MVWLHALKGENEDIEVHPDVYAYLGSPISVKARVSDDLEIASYVVLEVASLACVVDTDARGLACLLSGWVVSRGSSVPISGRRVDWGRVLNDIHPAIVRPTTDVRVQSRRPRWPEVAPTDVEAYPREMAEMRVRLAAGAPGVPAARVIGVVGEHGTGKRRFVEQALAGRGVDRLWVAVDEWRVYGVEEVRRQRMRVGDSVVVLGGVEDLDTDDEEASRLMAELREWTGLASVHTFVVYSGASAPRWVARMCDHVVQLPRSCGATLRAENGAETAQNCRGLSLLEACQVAGGRNPRDVRPRGGEVAMEAVAETRWDALVGLDAVRVALEEAVVAPLRRPEAFARMGVERAGGVLLHGPAGCGKTAAAQALCTAAPCASMSVRAPDLLSKYVGDTEAALRRVFARARQLEPCVLLIDEIDALGGRADSEDAGAARLLSQLLNLLDGIEARGHVAIVACTSRPDMLDAALLRPGRLDRHIALPAPDAPARADYLSRARSAGVHLASDVTASWFSALTVGYSFADMGLLLRRAELIRRAELSVNDVICRVDIENAAASILPPNFKHASGLGV